MKTIELVKKFKNGNIVLKPYTNDFYIDNIDQYYNQEITMKDLYFNQINGYMYLVDFNTQLVYDFSYCGINILIHLDSLLNDGCIKLYPLSKKASKELIDDLNNGY